MDATKKVLDDKEFIDILNDIYPDVNICGFEMCQGNILYECDNIAFREAKNNYEDSDSPWVCSQCDSEHNDQIEADNCCKVDYLISILEKLGFIGIDASLEESLIAYGMIYRHSDGYTIFCINPDSPDDIDSYRFDWNYISIDDVKDALEHMKEGFFSFIDESKADIEVNQDTIISLISSINPWNSWFTGNFMFTDTIDDMIQAKESELNSITNTKTEE